MSTKAELQARWKSDGGERHRRINEYLFETSSNARPAEASVLRSFIAGLSFADEAGEALDFRGLIFGIAIFNELETQGARFEYCGLRGTKFLKCRLPGALFSAATADYVDFGGDFSGASFSKTSLKKASLTQTNLSGADFSAAKAQACNFSDAVCRDAKFNSANLRLARFVRTDLRGASFAGADCAETSFADAQLEGAILPAGFQASAAPSGAIYALAEVDATLAELRGKNASAEAVEAMETVRREIVAQPELQWSELLAKRLPEKVMKEIVRAAEVALRHAGDHL